MTVYHFVKSRHPRHTVRCLSKLLAQAQLGKITGVAFIAILPHGFLADACGEAKDDPKETVKMLRHLKARLLDEDV